MFSMTVKSNIAEQIRRLKVDIEKQPLAVAKALTFTAEDVQKAEKAEIARVFDRPTPYARNSVFKTSATARTLRAGVWLKHRPPYGLHDGVVSGSPNYLEPQVYGGGRPLKGLEKRLRNAGLLPDGMYAVPGEGARLDSYGNMSRGQVMQILTQLKTFSESSLQRMNATQSKRSKRHRAAAPLFVGRPGGAPLGVWQRTARGVKPIIMFVRAPRYRQRFHFFDVALRVTNARFYGHLQRAIAREQGAFAKAA